MDVVRPFLIRHDTWQILRCDFLRFSELYNENFQTENGGDILEFEKTIENCDTVGNRQKRHYHYQIATYLGQEKENVRLGKIDNL